MAEDEPRLIIDSDWKQEAQQEKERLAREAAESPAGHALPEANFLEIVNMLAMQAVIGLGGMKLPDGRDMPPDVDLARHHIDLLAVLQQKTAGHLNDTEQRVLETSLHELRMAYVQATSAVAGTPGK